MIMIHTMKNENFFVKIRAVCILIKEEIVNRKEEFTNLQQIRSFIEGKINKHGYSVLFPPNISKNQWVAHYVPSYSEKDKYDSNKDSITIDFGLYKNKIYIDNAFSILSSEIKRLKYEQYVLLYRKAIKKFSEGKILNNQKYTNSFFSLLSKDNRTETVLPFLTGHRIISEKEIHAPPYFSVGLETIKNTSLYLPEMPSGYYAFQIYFTLDKKINNYQKIDEIKKEGLKKNSIFFDGKNYLPFENMINTPIIDSYYPISSEGNQFFQIQETFYLDDNRKLTCISNKNFLQ
jgi:hypothetical protein